MYSLSLLPALGHLHVYLHCNPSPSRTDPIPIPTPHLLSVAYPYLSPAPVAASPSLAGSSHLVTLFWLFWETFPRAHQRPPNPLTSRLHPSNLLSFLPSPPSLSSLTSTLLLLNLSASQHAYHPFVIASLSESTCNESIHCALLPSPSALRSAGSDRHPNFPFRLPRSNG